MLPKVLAQPRPAGRPDAVIGVVDRRRAAPEVKIVVQHPPPCAIVLARRFRTRHRDFPQGREERFMCLGEAGRFGRPVVHLGVDVDRVLAVPRRLVQVVPQALQVGRLATAATGSDQQVAAILEQQCHQLGIRARGEAFDTRIGRFCSRLGRAQVQAHALEQLAMAVRTLVAQRLVRDGCCLGQHRRVPLGGISADIPEVDEVRGAGEQQGRLGGALHAQPLPVNGHSAVRLHRESRFKADRATLDLTAQAQPATRLCTDLCGVGGTETNGKRQVARSAGGEPDCEHLPRKAGKDFLRVLDATR